MRPSLRLTVGHEALRCGHIKPSSFKKQHSKTLRLSGVREVGLYSLRQTFLTRLGQSGCDTRTLARIAGHSSIAMSARYVRDSEDAVRLAVERLGGHNSGHISKLLDLANDGPQPHLVETQDEVWWAVQDSNLRPPACKIVNSSKLLEARSTIAHKTGI